MRKVPDLPTAKLEPPRREPLFHCQIEVVTPMFGGGCETRSVDTTRLVTARSVRGHLRFWWRACKGVRYATARELYEAESALWGSTATPSQVDVMVEVTNSGKPCTVASLEKERKLGDGLRYALFAFKSDRKQKRDEAIGCENLSFELTIAGPETAHPDVESALWAWLLFGGVGARTRRGCGSLYCTGKYVPKLSDFRKHVLVPATTSDDFHMPILHGARILRGTAMEDVIDAWEKANRWMYEFRQGINYARNPGKNKAYGRSKWPEPDSIRRITSQHLPRHTPEHKAGVYFPRADLGLPIVFHFLDEGYTPNSEPTQTVLQPSSTGQTRMASPFILKPLMMAPRQAVPMVLLMNAPHAWAHPIGLVLKESVHNLQTPELNDPSKNGKVGPLNGKTPREAFLAFVKQQLKNGQLQEVTL